MSPQTKTELQSSVAVLDISGVGVRSRRQEAGTKPRAKHFQIMIQRARSAAGAARTRPNQFLFQEG